MLKKSFLQVVAFSVLVMPGLCFAQASSEADAQSLLSAFASYADLRIGEVRQNLQILAATDEARSGEWDNVKELLGVYQELDRGLVAWYMRPDGTYYTADDGLMDAKLSDRDYFADLAAGKEVVGALVVSKSTGQRSAVVAVPVKEGGKVVGAVGASVFLDKLAQQVDSALALRPEASFFAMAPDGRTTLHRKTDRHFLDPRELGSETLKNAANEMLSKESGETTYEFDNTTKKAIYRTSPLTQWRFVLTFNAPQP